MRKLANLFSIHVLRNMLFTLFCLLLVVSNIAAQTVQSIKADPGNNNPPPSGAILDLNGTPVPGGGNGSYQLYSISFVAAFSYTAVSFAIREDPAFISMANVSVVDTTADNGVNLLVNGNFSGGTYANSLNSSIPNNWAYANQYGATFGGIVESGSGFCYSYPNCWYDGAVQAYDVLSQTIPTIVGHTYQISFYVADNSRCGCNFSDVSTNGDTIDTGGNGINVTVYALQGLPPATQTGSTINTQTGTNLAQSFVFNNTAGNHVEFDFDFTTPFNNGQLSFGEGVTSVTPEVTSQGITHATYAQMVMGTASATTDCLTAPGLGTDSSGNTLCAEITIACTTNLSNTPMGDQCGSSTQRNLLLTQLLDTADINVATGTAPTLLMGPDFWSPTNTALTGLESSKLSPQSELTQLEASTDCACKGGGTGTILNSAFVFGNGEPEWNTLPTVPAWSYGTTVPVSFTSNPPTPPAACVVGGVEVNGPGCNGWVASPNESITWGEENLNQTPDTTFPVPFDQTATNQIACPNNGTWPAFGTIPQSFTANGTVTVGGPGIYEVHFFSTACDNQEELAFPGTVGTGSPLNQNLATFKTVSFGVDQTNPIVSITGLSGGIGNNTFISGSPVTATLNCTDDRSGIATGGCGPKLTLPLPPNNAAPVQPVPPVPAVPPARVGPTAGPLAQNGVQYSVTAPSGSGPQTFTAYATDMAGNQSSTTMQYCIGYNIVSKDNANVIGFMAPVANPTAANYNINSVKVSQAIPMQLTVTDCNGNAVTNLTLAPPNGTGTVVLSAAYATVCAVDNPDNTVSTAAAGNSGWQNLGGGTYDYNWKPLPTPGSCLSFSVNLGDGVQHTAYFKFK